MARSSTAVFQSPADGIEIIVRARTLKMSGSIGVAAVEVFSRSERSDTFCIRHRHDARHGFAG